MLTYSHTNVDPYQHVVDQTNVRHPSIEYFPLATELVLEEKGVSEVNKQEFLVVWEGFDQDVIGLTGFCAQDVGCTILDGVWMVCSVKTARKQLYFLI